MLILPKINIALYDMIGCMPWENKQECPVRKRTIYCFKRSHGWEIHTETHKKGKFS